MQKKGIKRRNKKKNDYVRKAFNYQSFYRTFTLPEYIDVSKIEASSKNRILHVDISKKKLSRKKQSNKYNLM
ncbi:Hsp20/alpha crystallin family protein [Flavobacterium sp. LS1P3]|uniref:Hsp20/alpha crystallin family protein n=1 Tax=Flavobacterium sp. LS1P3 TaxID=3401720 RepID=UPI003AABDAD5